MKYNIDNLYVGMLGSVSIGENEKGLDCLNIDSSKVNKPFIIFIKDKEKIKDYHDYGFQKEMFLGIDVITKKKYLLWENNNYKVLHVNSLSGYAIFKYFPIEQFIQENKRKISKSEIFALYDKLNNRKQDDEKETNREEVKDNILNLIIETNNRVKKMELDEDTKKKITEQLSELGEYYVNRMSEISNSSGLSLDNSEYLIQLECVKRLVEIESEIEDKDLVRQSNLKRQLVAFKKNLGTK